MAKKRKNTARTKNRAGDAKVQGCVKNAPARERFPSISRGIGRMGMIWQYLITAARDGHPYDVFMHKDGTAIQAFQDGTVEVIPAGKHGWEFPEGVPEYGRR